MKLYVWEDCLCDYTCGIMFAISETVDDARMELKKVDFIPDDELSKQPKEYDLSVSCAYCVWGGS